MLTWKYRNYYVDHIGYEVKYFVGCQELGLVTPDGVYHYFNGFMKLGIL